MKEMLSSEQTIRVTGDCVVELMSGCIVTAKHIKDVPEAVRRSGGRWPKDVKTKCQQVKSKDS